MLRLEFGILTQAAWVKHLLNMHDGEVRFGEGPGKGRAGKGRKHILGYDS